MLEDLKLEALFRGHPINHRPRIDLLSNAKTREAGYRFLHNIDSVYYLMTLPVNLVSNINLAATAWCVAASEVANKPYCDPQTFFDNEQALGASYERHVKTLAEEWESGEWAPSHKDRVISIALDVMTNTSAAIRGTHSYLEALLLNAWTAFEILAVDLWIQALNYGPQELVAKTDQVRSFSKGQGKSISLVLLYRPLALD